MERDHVHVLVEQSHGGIALLGRVEPHVEPHHLDGGLRVDRAHAEREGIDALQHFGDGETCHEARHACLAHAARSNACQVAALVVARIGRSHVWRGLVARDGLELHVRVVLRHLERGLHVAKTGREDDLVPRGGQVADDAFCIGTFGHVLDEGGFYLASQRRLHGLAAFVVLACPAGFGDRRDIDKTGLDGLSSLALVGRGLGKDGGDENGARKRTHTSRTQCGGEVFVHGVPLHGPGDRKSKRLPGQQPLQAGDFNQSHAPAPRHRLGRGAGNAASLLHAGGGVAWAGGDFALGERHAQPLLGSVGPGVIAVVWRGRIVRLRIGDEGVRLHTTCRETHHLHVAVASGLVVHGVAATLYGVFRASDGEVTRPVTTTVQRYLAAAARGKQDVATLRIHGKAAACHL